MIMRMDSVGQELGKVEQGWPFSVPQCLGFLAGKVRWQGMTHALGGEITWKHLYLYISLSVPGMSWDHSWNYSPEHPHRASLWWPGHTGPQYVASSFSHGGLWLQRKMFWENQSYNTRTLFGYVPYTPVLLGYAESTKYIENNCFWVIINGREGKL